MSDDGDELPERATGTVGETAGETLMRALDNIGRLEAMNPGAKVSHVLILYAVTHPPTERGPWGAHTYGFDETPGTGRHETAGLMREIDAALYADDDD